MSATSWHDGAPPSLAPPTAALSSRSVGDACRRTYAQRITRATTSLDVAFEGLHDIEALS